MRVARASHFIAALVIAGCSTHGSSAAAAARDAAPRPQDPVRLGISLSAAGVTSLAASPDGKFILTGGDDDSARLWEVQTGREVRRFKGPAEGGLFSVYYPNGKKDQAGTPNVFAVAFSADSKRALTGHARGVARMWDVSTGVELQSFQVPLPQGSAVDVRAVAFSPDGMQLAIGSGSEASIWSAQSGAVVQRLDTQGGVVRSVAYSPDGTQLLVGAEDGIVRLWSPQTGTAQVFDARAGAVTSVAFATDGVRFLSGSVNGDAYLWSPQSARPLLAFHGHTGIVNSVAFSSDGRRVLTGSNDGTARLWNVAGGHEQQRFEGHWQGLWAAAFLPGDRRIVTGSWDLSARLWDADTGREILRLQSHAQDVLSIAISKNGAWIATGGADGSVHLWDTRAGRQVRSVTLNKEHERGKLSVALSPDGERLAGASQFGAIGVWDTRSGRELHGPDARAGEWYSAAFSSDGRQVLIGGKNNAQIWDAQSGAAGPIFNQGPNAVWTSVLSPDGSLVLTCSHADRKTRLWDARTGESRGVLDAAKVYTADFSPDGAQVLTGGYDGYASLWDSHTGKLIRSFPGQSPVSAIGFSPDGARVLTGSWDGVAILWDARTGAKIGTLDAHAGIVRAVTFTPDGRRLLTGTDAGTTTIWSDAGQELARFASFDDGGWVVYDREGRFDASGAGLDSHLYWVFGNTSVDLSQLKTRYYVPQLLGTALGMSGHPLPAVRPIAALRANEIHPTVEIIASPTPAHPTLEVRVTNQGGGIGAVVVSINGKALIKDAREHGDADKNRPSLELKISLAQFRDYLLSGKDSHVEVVAYNAEGFLRSRGTMIESAPSETPQAPSAPSLWAVVVGVSKYANPERDLAYPALDAAQIAQAIDVGGRALFSPARVRLTLLAGGVDGALPPTKANLKKAFEDLQRAKPDDVVLVFLAGHGVAWNNAFYYPTEEWDGTDVADPAQRALQAVSSDELESWLIAAHANKQVIVIDTCEAGLASKSFLAGRSATPELQKSLDRISDNAGVYVLMGAAASKSSYEVPEYGHGLLTYALLEGITGAGMPLRENRFVDVVPLMSYVQDEVPVLAKGSHAIQQPIFLAPGQATGSFDILRGDEAAKRIKLPSRKPIVLAPRLQDRVKPFDAIGFDPILGEQLNSATQPNPSGGSPPLAVYVADSERAGGFVPNGRYWVQGNRLNVSVTLTRDGTELKPELPTECDAARPEICAKSLAQAIIERAAALAKSDGPAR